MRESVLRTVVCITGWMLLVTGLMGGIPTAPAQDSTSLKSPVAASSTPKDGAKYRSSSTDAGMVWRNDPLFYVAGDASILYNRSDSTAPVARLSVRTPVRRLGCEDKWCRVRTDEGREGFMPASALSNVWVRVSKEKRRVHLYRGAELIKTFEADLGYNAFADKKRRGGPQKRDHWRTPEGTFHVVHRNSESRFYKALVLNYPTVKDARQGLKKGLISQSQYEAIEQAQDEFRIPPMNTDLGGWIEIHGDGTGDATTWTHGCVAVRNQDMDVLWSVVEEGTPVLIE